jgi:uncharacterized protein
MSVQLPIPPRPDLSTAPSPGRPKASWSWYTAIGVYLVAFVLGALATVPVLAAFGQLTTPSKESGIDAAGAWATIVADLVITGVLLAWLTARHKRWRESIGLSEPGKRLRNWLWGYAVGLGLYPVVALGVGVILTLLFQAVTGHQVRSPEQVASHLSAGGVIAVVLLSLVVAPISEEFFFRGILFRSLRDRYGFWVGAIGSALAFGLVHYVPNVPLRDALLLQTTMVFTGIGLAWIYERRGTLIADIGAHMAFNTIGIVLILLLK